MGFYPAVGWVGGFWKQVVGGSQLESRKLSCVGRDGMTLLRKDREGHFKAWEKEAADIHPREFTVSQSTRRLS